MKRRHFMLAATAALLVGCESKRMIPRVTAKPEYTPAIEYPAVNLPYPLRQKNWTKGGSCVHATMVSLLRWQGQYKLAEHWRATHAGGVWGDGDLAQQLDAAGLSYASTYRKGDIRFLEWACSTRRGCGVTIQGGDHMVALVHFDEKWAGILDNNSTEKIIWLPRETFVAEWLNSDSWAVTPLMGPPMPPLKQRSTN